MYIVLNNDSNNMVQEHIAHQRYIAFAFPSELCYAKFGHTRLTLTVCSLFFGLSFHIRFPSAFATKCRVAALGATDF